MEMISVTADKYVPIIVKLARERGAEISVHRLEATKQARSAPHRSRPIAFSMKVRLWPTRFSVRQSLKSSWISTGFDCR